jgi:hypothetical protein
MFFIIGKFVSEVIQSGPYGKGFTDIFATQAGSAAKKISKWKTYL